VLLKKAKHYLLYSTKNGGTKIMPYVNDGAGKLDNFPKEPEMYQAEPLSANQKRNFVIVGVVGLLLVAGMIAVSITLS
jgi:hypothetical protein